MTAEQMIIDYGYWALLVGTFLEIETILIAAGLLAHQGYLGLHWVILSAFVGSFASDQTAFFIGRRGGMPLQRYGLQLEHVLNHWSAYLRVARAESQPHGGDQETPTRGYVLMDLGAQCQFKPQGEATVMLFAKANNLFNENVRNATSYLRNFAPEPGRGGEIGLRVSY